jgi:ABC-type transport system involved in cytochrome c biogenesis permease subunit
LFSGALVLGILHGLVLIVILVIVADGGHFLGHLNFLALQQAMDDITDLAITRTVVGWVSVLALGL